MACYATYEDYTGSYGGTKVGEEDFPSLALRVSAMVDSITFHRATNTEEVTLAVCAGVDCWHSLGGEITSEQNDGYRVDYRRGDSKELLQGVEGVLKRMLPNTLTNRGCWA